MRPQLIYASTAALVSSLFLAGCATTPAVALNPGQATLEQRQRQTRHFEDVTEPAMLSAGLGVLQDLGFTLDGSESKLGVITASRHLTSRRPLSSGELVKDLLWAALIPTVMVPYMAYDAATGVKEPQVVRVSLVTSPAPANGPLSLAVRVTAQRLVYKDEKLKKLIKVEPINDPAFYREFFVRLTQSAFLEGQKT
jgi:hypothetical protein